MKIALRFHFALAVLIAAIADSDPVLADQNAPLTHWTLAGDVKDHSGNGVHASNRGADLAAAGPDGRVSGAARFDGRKAYLDVADSPRLRFGTGDFSLALWAYLPEDLDDVPGDLLSKFDPVGRTGFTFSITSRAGVAHSQPNLRHLHFGIDDGKGEPRWIDRGRPGNAVYVHALAVHASKLYAGTCEPEKDQAGHVYCHDGGDRWIDCGSPDKCNAISTLAVHRGQLYAGTAKYRLAGSALPESENSNLGGRIFRYDGEKRWIDCGKLPEAEAVGGLVVFRGQLHASSLYRPAGFFRYDGEKRWVSVGTPGGKRVEALCPFNGQLFATGYDEGHVYRYDGKTWVDCGRVGESTQTYALAVHVGQLYVSTWPGGRVYRYRGDNDWTDCGRLGDELEVMGMAVHNGKLYAGTLPLARVYRFDGDNKWTNTGQLDRTPDVRYRRAWTMAEYQGQLFCGTLPSGRVHSFEAGKNVTYDQELKPGWRHLAAVREKDRLKLYVDGKLIATSTAFEPATINVNNNSALQIGFGANDFFSGSMRDVRVYDRALSGADVTALAATAANPRFLHEWGSKGAEPGKFYFPIGIAINAADEVFVTDHYNNRVQKFDVDGKLLAHFPVLPNPGGIAIDKTGNLLISHFPASRLSKETTPDRITVYSPAGKFISEWGKTGKGDAEFDYPGGIAVGKDGRIYVADQTNRRVQVFSAEGKFLSKWGEYGIKPGQFGGNVNPKSRVGGPQLLAVNSEGNVYTTEGSVGRVQKFTADGKFLLAWGDNGMGPGSFGGAFSGFKATLQGPIGICIDRQDRVWVSAAGGRIQQFTKDGKFLRGFGDEQGEKPGQFFAPHGLALDSRGNLYVVDAFNHRIQKFAVEP